MKWFPYIVFATILTQVSLIAEETKFLYHWTRNGSLSDEDSTLVLDVEVIDIRHIVHPHISHFDFGVAFKVLKVVKGDYDKSVIGIHIRRQAPGEKVTKSVYGFTKGQRTTIRATKTKFRDIVFFDERIP